ncbi:hypothetical protein Tcan_05730 [Toxocara canis]|uniref:Homeobox domain-containing protein n=1 Tax=Toxocara canis TaxID=6265 RepID=A0A0B2W2U9_TOXCA|nr:hypothetical protein Tcan_05730 [Toxocara canis]
MESRKQKSAINEYIENQFEKTAADVPLGLVQVANWKALPFDQITDNLDDTVESLLKDISNHITLKILTKQSATDSSSSQCISDLKQRLLKAAVSKQPHILATVDNQQIKDLIQQVVSGDDPSMLNFDQIQAINEWLEQLDDNRNDHKSLSSMSVRFRSLWLKKENSFTTRFNQLLEVPKLERWFRSDQNPSRQKLINYMNVLNGSNYRRHNSKITYQQICNWFSNQRAANRQSAKTNQLSAQNASVAQPLLVPPVQTALPAEYRPKFDFNALLENKQANGTANEVNLFDNYSSLVSPKKLVHVYIMQSAKTNQLSAQNASVAQPLLVPPVQTALPAEYRPKFDFNALLENKQANGTANEEFQRIDGGSDSPTPNDDASVHSVSDAGFEHEAIKQESTTSSPELSLDLNGSLASTSPKPRPSPAANGVATNGQMAQSQTPASTVARSRLMFDPLTELPVLEKWFEENPHPTWIQIDQYTEALNSCQYRQSYPPISTHNVKIWFKNRRAKCKRMQTGENAKLMI